MKLTEKKTVLRCITGKAKPRSLSEDYESFSLVQRNVEKPKQGWYSSKHLSIITVLWCRGRGILKVQGQPGPSSKTLPLSNLSKWQMKFEGRLCAIRDVKFSCGNGIPTGGWGMEDCVSWRWTVYGGRLRSLWKSPKNKAGVHIPWASPGLRCNFLRKRSQEYFSRAVAIMWVPMKSKPGALGQGAELFSFRTGQRWVSVFN